MNKPTSATCITSGAVPLQNKIRLTKWTASYPITKQLRLEDEVVQKTSTASQLYQGKITRIECSPSGLVDIHAGIGSNDCLSYALPKDSYATRILSKKKFNAAGQPEGSTTRTADEMEWPKGPAILMGDYDPPDGDESLDREALLEAFYLICPSLRYAAHIWSVSASSCIRNTKTGNEVSGIAGQRVYLIVAEGTDIPRAGKVLAKRAWLAGHGYIKISKAGSLLIRSIVDDSVFQSNRIDYCAPPICNPPLESNKPNPLLLGDAELALDTRVALPDLTLDEEATYQRLVAEEKAKCRPEANRVRADYQKQQVEKLVSRGLDREAAENLFIQAADHSILLADYVLFTEDGKSVTVDEILRDPQKWHGKHFCDPIEPDYHDDHRVACAYLAGPGRPSIYSYAHGGRRFYLSRSVRTIRLQKGERAAYMAQMADTFIEFGEFYRRGNVLVAITENGGISLQLSYQILAAMDRYFRFEKFASNQWVAADATIEHSKMFSEAYGQRFPALKAVLTTQNIDPITGRLLTKPGYDADTAVYMAIDGVMPTVFEKPDLPAVEESLRVLWWAVRLFPFATPLDETVMLTAMLTAVVRPLLPTAPGFGFDASTQGSGKTLLEMVLCVLMGTTPAVSPHTDSNSDEELRKRFFSLLLAGHAAIVIDNILGEFDSASLAALLTTSEYSDRVLGRSQIETIPTNVLVLLSGNNLILKGDLPRRIFKCRIAPNVESPHQREFDFDPVEFVRACRHELVAASLTLFKAYLATETVERIGRGRTASFEVWDDLVRQTVCWLASLQETGVIARGINPGGDYFPRLVDPMLALNESVKEDPLRSRLGQLLTAWALEVGTGKGRKCTVTVKDLMARSVLRMCRTVNTSADEDSGPPLLHDILVEMAGNPIMDEINSRSLGKTLSKNKDRIVDGLCLRQGEPRQGAATWWVEEVSVSTDSREFGESSEFASSPLGKIETAIPTKQAKNKPTKLTKLTNATAPLTAKRAKGKQTQ